eukprot:g5750.t1
MNFSTQKSISPLSHSHFGNKKLTMLVSFHKTLMNAELSIFTLVAVAAVFHFTVGTFIYRKPEYWLLVTHKFPPL